MNRKDIINKKFPHSFNGYDISAVDLFLDEIIREFDRKNSEAGLMEYRLEHEFAVALKYIRLLRKQLEDKGIEPIDVPVSISDDLNELTETADAMYEKEKAENEALLDAVHDAISASVKLFADDEGTSGDSADAAKAEISLSDEYANAAETGEKIQNETAEFKAAAKSENIGAGAEKVPDKLQGEAGEAVIIKINNELREEDEKAENLTPAAEKQELFEPEPNLAETSIEKDEAFPEYGKRGKRMRLKKLSKHIGKQEAADLEKAADSEEAANTEETADSEETTDSEETMNTEETADYGDYEEYDKNKN